MYDVDEFWMCAIKIRKNNESKKQNDIYCSLFLLDKRIGSQLDLKSKYIPATTNIANVSIHVFHNLKFWDFKLD